MKLRQLKRRHVKRLRRRIVMARVAALRLEWKQAMDDVTGALVDALVAPRELLAAALAEGRTRVRRWATEGDQGIQVADITEWALEQQETRNANPT